MGKERAEAVEKTGPKSILLLSKHVPKVLKSHRQHRRPQLITRQVTISWLHTFASQEFLPDLFRFEVTFS